MIGARRILIRDWRTNRLFWIAACLAHLLYGAAILRRSLTTPSYVVDAMGLLLGLADFVVLAIATAAVVQADGPSSRLGDWRTRPVPGGQILLAKMGSILAVLVVPRFLIGVAGGPLFGLTLEESAASAGLHLGTDLALCSILLAFGATTRNIGQLVLAGGVCSLAAMLAVSIFLFLRPEPGIDATLLVVAAGVVGLTFVCGGLSVGLYISERPAMFRIAIGAACMIWLPVAQAVFGIAEVVAPSRTDETETARKVQVEPAVYAWDRNTPEDGPNLYTIRGDYSLLPFRLSAPVGGALSMEGGSLDADHAPAVEWGSGYRSFSRVAFDDRNRMLRIPRQQTAVAGTVQVALRYRVFSPSGREPLFPADGRYHRVKRLGSCRFGSTLLMQFECVGAAYSPCFGFERFERNAERQTFQTFEYCPPDRPLQFIRWPLPYAFTTPVPVYSNNIFAATFWQDEGRLERRFTISEAEFQRRLISPATVQGSDTTIQEP